MAAQVARTAYAPDLELPALEAAAGRIKGKSVKVRVLEGVDGLDD